MIFSTFDWNIWPRATTNLSYPWEQEKASLLEESSGQGAWNIYTFGLHHNWRNGKGVLDVLLLFWFPSKKGSMYAKTISWIRTRTSFSLLRSTLVSLRGSRTRRVPCDIKNVDIDVEVVEGAIQSDYWCVSLLLNGKYSLIRHWERYLIFLFF